jgi:hypothetical protein
MIANELARDINEIKQFLDRQDLLMDWNLSKIVKLDKGKRRITWTEDDAFILVFNSGCMKVEDYLQIVRERCFSYLLCDGALVQMTYAVRYGSITNHRLLYLPCPCDFAEEEMEGLSEGESFDDVITGHLERSALKEARMAGQIRIDCDYAAAKPGHPVTHVHLSGFSSCRIPVTAPISPLLFMGFILRHFYKTELVTRYKPTCYPSSIEPKERNSLHLHHEEQRAEAVPGA